MKKDKRSITSKKNGLFGGRPPLSKKEKLRRNLIRTKKKYKNAIEEYNKER
ncbi:hypothetical protein KAR91_14325 [Candidatus Pacearchaeota archaeon]|nr:hypothetical protein [Candidatus Pacearchaeota archaeon]